MSVTSGRDMHRDARHPQPTPLDAATLRRSAIARGRASYAARDGDRDARALLASLADEDNTEPPAA